MYAGNPDTSTFRNLTHTDGRVNGGLKAVSLATAPKSVRARRRLNARLKVVDTQGVLDGQGLAFELDYPTCRATVGGRALNVVDGGFQRGNGYLQCVWFVPRSARGKVVHGTVGIDSCGSKLHRSFSRRVRG